MHRAPAVSFSVTRSRWHGWGIAALSGLALFALVAFAWEQAPLDERSALLALAIVATGAVALVAWQRSPEGRLRWDGQYWYWSGFTASSICRLSLLVDLQHLVLVSVVARDNAPMWLWIEGTSDVATWKALRRAIISSRSTPDEDGDQTELASEGDVR